MSRYGAGKWTVCVRLATRPVLVYFINHRKLLHFKRGLNKVIYNLILAMLLLMQTGVYRQNSEKQPWKSESGCRRSLACIKRNPHIPI